MAGRSGRINRQEAALAALIEAPNLRAAALACGVPERTLRRWMADEEKADAAMTEMKYIAQLRAGEIVAQRLADARA